MLQGIITTLLGPSGNVVLDWYVRHNLLVNGFLILVAILALLLPVQSQKVQDKIHRFWAKTPFVLTEGDRIAIEKARGRVAARRGKGKRA